MAGYIPDIERKEARGKGGRASGGTRYYLGKDAGENRMVRLMQQALNEKNGEAAEVPIEKEPEPCDKCKLMLAMMEESEKETKRLFKRLEEAIRCSTKRK